MKVAITSTDETLDSMVDRRFGRCHYFVIYDTSSGAYEIIPNPNIDNVEGAGVSAVQTIAGKGVKKVVSGEFGVKVKSLFDQLQIQLISVPDQSKSVQQIIDLLKQQQV